MFIRLTCISDPLSETFISTRGLINQLSNRDEVRAKNLPIPPGDHAGHRAEILPGINPRFPNQLSTWSITSRGMDFIVKEAAITGHRVDISQVTRWHLLKVTGSRL